LGADLGVEAVSLEIAPKWQKEAYEDGKDAGYREAVKSLEESVAQLVRLGVQTQQRR
jgi:hypothetical protein